jgi:DNA replication protein DnaC
MLSQNNKQRVDLFQTQKKLVTWECRQGEPDTYENVKYVHEGHGIIVPVWRESQGVGRFYRAMCPCERVAQAKNRQIKEQHARMRRVDALKKETFGWLGKSWSDAGLEAKTFANFEAHRQREAFDTVQSFPDIMRGTLVLHGAYGTGKTHLLAALCNALNEQDKSCLFTSATKLFSAIQDQVGRGQSYISLLNRAMHTPLLVIDDIDKAKATDFRQEVYFSIIDERTRRELPTAISTNRLAELESFVGGAVRSRLRIGQIDIEMNGSDYREEL